MTDDTTQKFYFDDSFQQGIFQLMMEDPDFCYKATHILKGEYFKNQYYAFFFEMISSIFKELKRPPTPNQICNELLKVKPEQRPPYVAIFEKIVKPTMARDFDYIRSRLGHFVKRSMWWQFHRKLSESKLQDPDALHAEGTRLIEQIGGIDFAEDEFMTLADLDRVLQDSASETEKLIPTGLPSLDKAMGGGIPRQTLTVALGGTNVGKSIFLINLSYHAIKSGYRVLYVNLEGQENQPLLRLVSRATQTPYGMVRGNRFSDRQALVKSKFVESNPDRLHFKHVNSFGYTVEQLYSYAKDKKMKFDFDVMVVDYGQLLFSKAKHEGLRHQMAYVHRGLASIAAELDVAVVTVAQATRDMQEKNRKGSELLRMDDVSECFEIVRVAAQVITINRSEQDERSDRVRILLDKQRDGRKGVVEICKTNFSTISLYGAADEGLGFMSADDYLNEELSRVSEQAIDGKVK